MYCDTNTATTVGGPASLAAQAPVQYHDDIIGTIERNSDSLRIGLYVPT